MIATRTRAFGNIVILAGNEFGLVGKPSHGVVPKRRNVSGIQALGRLRRTVRAKRARATGYPGGSRVA
jgi:hypothetical protein